MSSIYERYEEFNNYKIYELMFDLKVAYKKCIELHSGNMDHFNNILCSVSIDILLNAYNLFISPITEFYIDNEIDRLYHSYNIFARNHIAETALEKIYGTPYVKEKRKLIDYISEAICDIYCLEYDYFEENTPSLCDGKFFLKNPHLNHKSLFYKKLDSDTFSDVFSNMPIYRRIFMLANYEDVVV